MEKQFRSIAGMQTHLLQIPAALKTSQLGINRKQRHTFRTLGRVSLDRQNDDITMLTIGDKGFLAVDDVLVTVFHGAGLHALQVATRTGLCHADGTHTFTTGHLWQPMEFLLLCTQVQNIGRNNVGMHGYGRSQSAVAKP